MTTWSRLTPSPSGVAYLKAKYGGPNLPHVWRAALVGRYMADASTGFNWSDWKAMTPTWSTT